MLNTQKTMSDIKIRMPKVVGLRATLEPVFDSPMEIDCGNGTFKYNDNIGQQCFDISLTEEEKENFTKQLLEKITAEFKAHVQKMKLEIRK